MPISWTLLMNSAPIIVEGARELLKTINKKKEVKQEKDDSEHPKLHGLESRIMQLESSYNEMMDYDKSQSELIQKLAEQNSQMLIALRKMRFWVITTAAISCTAIILVLV